MGFEPMDLALTKGALYRLSYVGGIDSRSQVGREGVEPPNDVVELIYSQRPLASWIPAHQLLTCKPTARIELAAKRLQVARSTY